MNEQELNRKLAEWAGFTLDLSLQHSTPIKSPDGDFMWKCPDFTQSLDDCFKWLVPKLPLNYDLYLFRHHEAPEEYHCSILCINWMVGLKKLSRPIFTEHKYPALALCLAIENLIEKGGIQ